MPCYNRDPKREHNFDNHPRESLDANTNQAGANACTPKVKGKAQGSVEQGEKNNSNSNNSNNIYNSNSNNSNNIYNSNSNNSNNICNSKSNNSNNNHNNSSNNNRRGSLEFSGTIFCKDYKTCHPTPQIS